MLTDRPKPKPTAPAMATGSGGRGEQHGRHEHVRRARRHVRHDAGSQRRTELRRLRSRRGRDDRRADLPVRLRQRAATGWKFAITTATAIATTGTSRRRVGIGSSTPSRRATGPAARRAEHRATEERERDVEFSGVAPAGGQQDEGTVAAAHRSRQRQAGDRGGDEPDQHGSYTSPLHATSPWHTVSASSPLG